MQIVCVSDTHGNYPSNLPEGDILVHAGDYSYLSRFSKDHIPTLKKELEEFNAWLGSIKDNYEHIVFVPGNHDWYFEVSPDEAIKTLSNAMVLNDSGIELCGHNIWGSSVTPEFCNWAFNRRRGDEIQRHWDLIPEDTSMLITHGPPAGTLDNVGRNNSVGCENLRHTVNRINPNIHIFGHIHEGYGTIKKQNEETMHHETIFVNASYMKRYYYPINKPIVISQ